MRDLDEYARESGQRNQLVQIFWPIDGAIGEMVDYNIEIGTNLNRARSGMRVIGASVTIGTCRDSAHFQRGGISGHLIQSQLASAEELSRTP